MDELMISGKRYISTRRAGKEYHYHGDYIGQLIRGGKVAGQKVGRSWYVSEASLAAYLRNEKAERESVKASKKKSAPVVYVGGARKETPADPAVRGEAAHKPDARAGAPVVEVERVENANAASAPQPPSPEPQKNPAAASPHESDPSRELPAAPLKMLTYIPEREPGASAAAPEPAPAQKAQAAPFDGDTAAESDLHFDKHAGEEARENAAADADEIAIPLRVTARPLRQAPIRPTAAPLQGVPEYPVSTPRVSMPKKRSGAGILIVLSLLGLAAGFVVSMAPIVVL